MEKIKVVKAIPGILAVGDVLISPESGSDFCLQETNITKNGSNERFVSLDYVTVSENIPEFFVFEQNEEVEDVKIEYTDDRVLKAVSPFRGSKEIEDRYRFFEDQFNNSVPGSEPQVVYRNLLWFIDWLRYDKELL